MAATTEQAFEALYQLIADIGVFRTVERDIRKWSAVESASASLPALFQEQAMPMFDSKVNIPTILRLRCDLAIICDVSDTIKVPSTTLNALVDAVLTALTPDPIFDERQTLGGVVYDCKPMGSGFYRDASSETQRAYAMIPIEILVTM